MSHSIFFLLRAPFGQYGPVAAFELYLYTAVDSRSGPLDQGGVEPRQAVSPKALRPWTIPLRYSVGWQCPHSNACAVAVPSKTVLLKRVLARSATISSNVWSSLLWYSCHPLSAVIGHPLGGFSTCSRSLTTLMTTLIIVPATRMSILALSPNRVIRAVQMESLITPCAAKCSMGSQSCQWKGSILLSVTIRRIEPFFCCERLSASMAQSLP